MTTLTVREALCPCEYLMPLLDGMALRTAAGYEWATNQPRWILLRVLAKEGDV